MSIWLFFALVSLHFQQVGSERVNYSIIHSFHDERASLSGHHGAGRGSCFRHDRNCSFRSQFNEPTASGSDNYSKDLYYKRDEGPKRHFRLGYEVFLGALILVFGLYYTSYAFSHGARLKIETGIAYLLIGMAGMFVGVYLILAYGEAVF